MATASLQAYLAAGSQTTAAAQWQRRSPFPAEGATGGNTSATRTTAAGLHDHGPTRVSPSPGPVAALVALPSQGATGGNTSAAGSTGQRITQGPVHSNYARTRALHVRAPTKGGCPSEPSLHDIVMSTLRAPSKRREYTTSSRTCGRCGPSSRRRRSPS